ncbi:hypothetical protein QQP08_020063, partial [Theobroma cacao]
AVGEGRGGEGRGDFVDSEIQGEVKCMFSFLVIEWISVLLQFL